LAASDVVERSASGRRGVEADEEQAGEVSPFHSSEEASEQTEYRMVAFFFMAQLFCSCLDWIVPGGQQNPVNLRQLLPSVAIIEAFEFKADSSLAFRLSR
jgi:hypothetical protein